MNSNEYEDLRERIKELEARVVTRVEYSVVRNVVFGLVGATLLSVLAAVLHLVVVK